MRKFVGDPAPSGKGGGIKRLGDSASTKKALAHAGGKGGKFGRKG